MDFISDDDMKKLDGGQDFISDDDFAKMQEKPSELSSAGLGAVDAGSLGFADEAYGAVVGGFKALTGPRNYDDTYREARDEARNVFKNAEQANPKSYMAGQIGGGLATSFVPGVGLAKGAGLAANVARGAALGGVAGIGSSEADDFSKDALLGTAVGGATGGVGYGVGKVIEKGAGALSQVAPKVADKIDINKPVENLDELLAISKQEGVQLTPAALSSSNTLKQLEEALSSSPSYWGNKVRKTVTDSQKSIQELADRVLSGKQDQTAYQIGESTKAGIKNQLLSRKTPISKVFDEVAESTKQIPINEKSIQAITNNINKLPEVRMFGNAGNAQKFIDALGNAKNANDLKILNTALNLELETATGADKAVLSAIKNKFSNFEKNTLKRSIINWTNELPEGQGKQLLNSLSSARKGWGEMLKDVRNISKTAKLGNTKNVDDFLNKIDTVPSEKILDKLFNTGDVRQLEVFQKNFPDLYEKLRQVKLNEVSNVSETPNQLIRQLNKISPEGQSKLLGNNLKSFNNLKTIQDAIPDVFNPSGTAKMANVVDGVFKSNIKDIPNYIAYKAMKSNLGSNLSETLKESPEVFGKYAPILQQAAQRGGHALAVTNYLLQQKEPDYREQVKALEADDGQ